MTKESSLWETPLSRGVHGGAEPTGLSLLTHPQPLEASRAPAAAHFIAVLQTGLCVPLK